MATNVEDITRRIMEGGSEPPPADAPPTDGQKRDVSGIVDQIMNMGEGPTTRRVERESLAAFVGQEELGKAGDLGFGTRFDIAAADTKAEKVAAFKRQYPEGDLVVEPATGSLLFRKDKSKAFAKVDADFLKGGGREVVADVLEFVAADLPAIAGETAALVRSRGASGVVSLIRMAGGAAGGDILGESVEDIALGEESVLSADAAQRAGGQAVTSFFGGLILDKFGRPLFNMARGAGLLGTRTGAVRAMQSAERLGLPEFPVNLISDNPMVKKLGGQSGALVPTLSRYVENMEVSTALVLRQFGEQARAGRIPDVSVLEKSLADDSKRFLGTIRKNLGKLRTPLEEGGASIKQSIAQFDELSSGRVNLAYASARSIEAPKFEVGSLRDTAAEVEALAAQMGPDGASVADLATRIKNLDPDLPPQTIQKPSGETMSIEATDQIRFMRSQAFDLKTPAPGDIRRAPDALAARLYGALTRTLRNPLNENAKFVDAWRKADRLAAQRFNTREQAVLMSAAKSETPADLAARLGDIADPRNIDNLKVLRSVMPEAKFTQFQNATMERLIADPFALSGKLKGAEPEVLRRLFSTGQVAQLKKAATDFDKLASTNVRTAMKDQKRIGAAVMDMAGQGKTEGIFQLRKFVNRNGGLESPLGRSVRSGIIDGVIERAVRFDEGAPRVNFQALSGALDDLRKTGAIRLLQQGDIQFLNDVRRVQDVLRLSPDAGTSIQAAEAAAGARTLSMTAVQTIIENVGTGRFFTSKIGRRILIGAGKEKLGPSVTVRMIGGTAAIVASDAEAVSEKLGDLANWVSFGLLEGEKPPSK